MNKPGRPRLALVTPPAEEMLTVPQAAKMWGVRPKTIYKWRSEGKIAAYHFFGKAMVWAGEFGGNCQLGKARSAS